MYYQTKMKRKAMNQITNYGKYCQIECSICAKTFRSNNLNKHMLTHNLEEPCSKCGKSSGLTNYKNIKFYVSLMLMKKYSIDITEFVI